MALNPYAPPEDEPDENAQKREPPTDQSRFPPGLAFFVLAWLLLVAMFILADPKAILLGIPLLVSVVWYVTAKRVK